jgi:hypothetical protein
MDTRRSCTRDCGVVSAVSSVTPVEWGGRCSWEARH